ncbi:MAG: UDP-galactopyranose mutase [Odoribacteraceae bacterium]|jgi:UDP-galactopyranose mutase|nr:UDP-galactopyranose mutase [Odoribacteraceae bacterium]
MKVDYLVVGSGLSGAIFAREATRRGKRCMVIEKREQAGGNIRCETREGINVHLYGAHIFHTSQQEVWDYVNRLTPFNHFINSPLAYYRGRLFNLPFNMNTFYQLWGCITPDEARAEIARQVEEATVSRAPTNLEEQALALCGKDIYLHLIKGYTEKQWGREATALPPEIIRRVPLRFTFDNNYFNDTCQGIPVGGYNRLMEKLLEGIEVRLACDFFDDRPYFESIADKILYTGRVDDFFNRSLGTLEYRSLHFDHQLLEQADFQGNAVVNYTERAVPYTRIIEHKHFEFGTQPHTVITREYPDEYSRDHEPYYPVNDARNEALLARYRELAATRDRVIFRGRLAEYKYHDMDDTVASILQLIKTEFHEDNEQP